MQTAYLKEREKMLKLNQKMQRSPKSLGTGQRRLLKCNV